jgi:hypothetical protein
VPLSFSRSFAEAWPPAAAFVVASALVGCGSGGAGTACGADAACAACDGPCVDGGDGADLAAIEAASWDAATHPNYMFVTSRRYPTDFDHIEVVDGYCEAAARAAGLPGRYRAWLSSQTVNALDRLAGARGWLRPDGQVFADTVDDIKSGRIASPPFIDELGGEIHTPLNDPVITGTDLLASSTMPCDHWTPDAATSGGPPNETFGGTTDATGGDWSSSSPAGCGPTLARFYCFGVDGSAPVKPVPVPGRKAFVTAAMFKTDLGLAGADALCADEAAAAGLGGKFLALLATSTASAASRFADLDGAVWVRLDGVPLNRAGESPFDEGGLLAPLNVDSTGTYNLSGYVTVGAHGPRALALPALTGCRDWTSVACTDVVLSVGDPSILGDWFRPLRATPFPCGTISVYCLEH